MKILEYPPPGGKEPLCPICPSATIAATSTLPATAAAPPPCAASPSATTTTPPAAADVPATPPPLVIPALEDRATLQQALSKVLDQVAKGMLDLPSARVLLYGLQIAQSNLPPHKLAPPATETVEEITLDEHHQPLAPEQEFLAAPHERTLEEILSSNGKRTRPSEAADEQRRPGPHRKQCRRNAPRARPAVPSRTRTPVNASHTMARSKSAGTDASDRAAPPGAFATARSRRSKAPSR